MGIFDPQVDANIAPTQQVGSGPSGLQTLGNLLGGAINAYGAGMKVAAASAPTAGERKDALQNAQIVGFSDSLLKVEALRRDGRHAEADRAEKAVLVNARRHGLDISSGEVKASYRAVTGRDPEFMGLSDEERVSNELIKTPDFQNAFIASYASGKEMSAEERKNFSLAVIAKNQAHAMMINNENIAWHEGRQEAFTGAITNFQGTTLGALQLAASEGRIIPLATIDQAQVSWDAQKAALVRARPSSLSDSDWKSVQAQIDATDASFALLRSMSSGEAIDAKIAQAASAAVMQMDGTAVQKQLLTKIIKDPNVYKDFGLLEATDFKEMLEATMVSDFDMGNFGVMSDPTLGGGAVDETTGEPKLFPDSVMKDIEGLDAQDLLKQAKTGASVLGMGGTEDLNSNPEKTKAFVGVASKAFASMTTISKDNKEFVSGKAIKEIFDGTIIAGIEAVSRTNPQAARTLYRQGEEALNQQDVIATQALRKMAEANPAFVVADDGRIEMSTDVNSWLGGAIIEDGVKLQLRDIADQYYGGNMADMFTDRGRLVDPTVLETKAGREFLRGGLAAGIRTNVAEMNGMLATVKTIRDKRNQFRAGADALTPKAEVASADAQAIAAGALGALDATNVRGFELIADDKPFLDAVGSASNNLGIRPADLLAAMSFETIGTFSPAIKNPNGSATGLIQFLEKTAGNLGTTTKALAGMSRADQMKYVERYLAPYKGKMKNAGDVYMAIHWPAAIGKGDDYVMYKEGTDAYKANKNLDMNGDGTVTRGETLTRLQSAYKQKPSITTTELSPQSAGAGPEVGSAPLQPTAPAGVDLVDAAQIAGMGAREAVRTETDVPREAPNGPRSIAFEEASVSAAKEADARAMEKLTTQQRAQIEAKGFRPDEVVYFDTQAEAEAALDAGKVTAGTLYVTKTGNVFLLK